MTGLQLNQPPAVEPLFVRRQRRSLRYIQPWREWNYISNNYHDIIIRRRTSTAKTRSKTTRTATATVTTYVRETETGRATTTAASEPFKQPQPQPQLQTKSKGKHTKQQSIAKQLQYKWHKQQSQKKYELKKRSKGNKLLENPLQEHNEIRALLNVWIVS